MTQYPSMSQRREALVKRLADEAFRERVAEWARRDEGRLETRESVRNRIRGEFEILMDALGPWAAVPPEELFPELDWWQDLR